MKQKILNYMLASMLAVDSIVVMLLGIMALASIISIGFIICGFSLMLYVVLVGVIVPVWFAKKFISGDENADRWLKDGTYDFFSWSFELLMYAKCLFHELYAFAVKSKDSIMTKLKS